MLTIDKYVTMSPEQWEIVIEGARNPMNSWDRMDSEFGVEFVDFDEDGNPIGTTYEPIALGENDHSLLMRLAKGGPVHAKYRRMMPVWIMITAPLYWWKEFDTYKVGTVANSCSTMHKIHAKEFTLDDFSHEHLTPRALKRLKEDIEELNYWRDIFLNGGNVDNLDGTISIYKPRAKEAWWQMIQLLTSSYNQKRLVKINYEVGHNIELWRSNHKLDEWHVFCDFLRSLGYSELMTAKIEEMGE